jgi:hypothetical protein
MPAATPMLPQKQSLKTFSYILKVQCSMFNVQSTQRVRAFKMQKYIFRKRKHHFLCYFLLNNPQKPKVPLDPKGRFHSEAEKECSKFKVGANLRVSPQSS